jgi:cell wall-associated NlpC family hydrolase
MRKSFLIKATISALAMTMIMAATALADTADATSTGDSLTVNPVVNASDSLAGVSSVLDSYYSTVESGTYSKSIEVEIGALVNEDIAKAATVLEDYENLGIATVTNYLNVRELPSSDNSKSKIIGKMVHNTACEILDYADGWYRVQSGPVTGYVSADYIVTGDEAITIALEEAELRAIVNSDVDTLNVRKEPSTSSTIIDKVSGAERYTVLEQLDGWVKIETVTGDEGYVSAEYVEVKYALNEAVEFTPVMTSSLRQSIIEYAQRFIGNPYVWGGTSLTKGADCSGFTMSVFANFGIKLSHSSKAQAGEGKVIDYSQIRPGDLIFYGRSGVSGIGHVAIYIGNGKIVHAASERTGITISSAKFKTILKVVNVIGD